MVIEFDDEPVIVALNVKYNPIASDNAGISVGLFYIIWSFPVGLLSCFIPSFQILLSVGVLLPKFFKGSLGNDSFHHRNSKEQRPILVLKMRTYFAFYPNTSRSTGSDFTSPMESK